MLPSFPPEMSVMTDRNENNMDNQHLYDEGTSTYGMKDGYRLRVVTDEGVHGDSPLTWNDEETKDGWAYKQWAAGEVYIVDLEKRVRLVNADDPDDVREDWDMVDSLAGCYLTPADLREGILRYSAWDVAKENFPDAVKAVTYSYKVQRITNHGRRHENRESGAHSTIAAALDEIAPEGDREGTNAYTLKLKGEERERVLANLERRGRSGHGWVDFHRHTIEVFGDA